MSIPGGWVCGLLLDSSQFLVALGTNHCTTVHNRRCHRGQINLSISVLITSVHCLVETFFGAVIDIMEIVTGLLSLNI